MQPKNSGIILGLLLVAIGLQVAQAEIEDLISSFVNIAVGQIPNNINGTESKYKSRALSDKSNVDIYDSSTQFIIRRSGFKQRTYEVTSDDGYITQLINLINPLADRDCLKQPPVMLFHGGLTDSSSYLLASAIQHHPEKFPRSADGEDGPITSSNRSLAFMLANQGYDVWLVGTRGSNGQNMGHVKYKARMIDDILRDLSAAASNVPSEAIAREFVDTIKYFDYSFDELVEYEYPRQIEAVLKLTGAQEVNLVGVSFATPILFKLLSSNKLISRRVNCYAAALPLLNLKGSSNLIKFLAEVLPKIPRAFGTVLVGVILSKPVRDFLRRLNRYRVFKMISTLAFGSSPKYQTFLEEPVVGHLFLSTGFKEIQHFAQEIRLADLQKFDYGPEKNEQLYGSRAPKRYDLKKFNARHWLIATSANDILGTPASADQYIDMIPRKPYRRLNIANYNHLDMVAAFDNDVQINLPVLQFFDRFQLRASNTCQLSEEHSPVESGSRY